MAKLGLVCMRHKKGFKKGFSGINSIKKAPQKEINQKLNEATLYNLNQTMENIRYCMDNKISAYRVSSEIVPFYEFWNWENDVILSQMRYIEKLAKMNNITLTVHPDQFTVLNSKEESIVEASKGILKHHSKLCDYMGIQHMIIHTGGVYGDKDEAIIRFVDNYLALPQDIQDLICLENCHYFSANDVKLISDLCGVRLCYDVHHERVINGEIETKQHILNIARLQPSLCHISSGRNNPTHKPHADYISKEDVKMLKDICKEFPDMIFEVEAKCKELAIEKIISN